MNGKHFFYRVNLILLKLINYLTVTSIKETILIKKFKNKFYTQLSNL